MAWSGVLFSAGALHSVRLALTDLLAATLQLTTVDAIDARQHAGIASYAWAGAATAALLGLLALWWRRRASAQRLAGAAR